MAKISKKVPRNNSFSFPSRPQSYSDTLTSPWSANRDACDIPQLSIGIVFLPAKANAFWDWCGYQSMPSTPSMQCFCSDISVVMVLVLNCMRWGRCVSSYWTHANYFYNNNHGQRIFPTQYPLCPKKRETELVCKVNFEDHK